MNGYTNTPANTCEAVPAPATPGTMKDIMLETTDTLGRVSHMLDAIWASLTEPGMNMDTPPRNPPDCLISTAVMANEIATRLTEKVERLCKVLGV